ncbi:hypothetical protein P3W45_001667 [Vairimorpha bombi]|jgi:hypothetical protein
MVCITLLQFTYAASQYYMYTLYNGVDNKVKIALFISKDLRDAIRIKAEVEEKEGSGIDMKFDRVNDPENVLRETAEQIGAMAFDKSLFDVYCTEYTDIPFNMGNLTLNFESEAIDQVYKKDMGGWFCNSSGFSVWTENWLVFVYSYDLFKKIENDFTNYLNKIRSEDTKNVHKALKEKIETNICNINVQLKRILVFSEEYKNKIEKGLENTQELLSQAKEIDDIAKLFEIEYLNLKDNTNQQIKSDDMIKEECTDEDVESKDELVSNKNMCNIFGIDANTLLIGLFIGILGVLVAILFK